MSQALTYPFTEADAQRAYDEWGCNCGPSALAFALQVPLEAMRHLIPNFDERRYTSPTMMKAALRAARVAFQDCPLTRGEMFHFSLRGVVPALVRVQWTGPWTEPGANPKWAYRYTHWITAYTDGVRHLVFDVNGGARTMKSWETEIVPSLIESIPRASGGWFLTHIWRLNIADRLRATSALTEKGADQ